MPTSKRILLLYHFMRPDSNVSAQHFSQLGQSLAELGYTVCAWPSNRTRSGGVKLGKTEFISGVKYERVSRFDLNQSRNIWRLLNAFIILNFWLVRFLMKRKHFDTIILGSDPIFSYFAVPIFKLFNPNIRILYWTFDLHPEGTIAEGTKIPSFILKFITFVGKYCYSKVDRIIPLSECMRKKLEKNYGIKRVKKIIVPWAIEENPVTKQEDIQFERKHLFGNSKVAILYSGNYGKCHDLEPFLHLAECAKGDDRFGFCLAGNAASDAQILREIEKRCLTNVTLAEMVPYEKLSARLKAADFHFVSIKRSFSGVVVPSKMFGALAMDRPVIISADEDCALGELVESHQCGLSLDTRNMLVSAQLMLSSLLTKFDEYQKSGKCRRVYDLNFSREIGVKYFNEML